MLAGAVLFEGIGGNGGGEEGLPKGDCVGLPKGDWPNPGLNPVGSNKASAMSEKRYIMFLLV